MFQQLLTIARNTFTESIRQPIFSVLLIMAVLALVLNPMVSANTLDDDNKQLLDIGLSILATTGFFLAAFTATGVVSQEVENKTVLTVVSKPIARPVFVLGKFLGVSAAIALAYWALSLVFLLTIRHKVLQTASEQFDTVVITFGVGGLLLALALAAIGNYLYHWVFTSSFALSFAAFETLAWVMVLLINPHWQFQTPAVDFHPQYMIGMLLLFEGLLILIAIAITVSTRLGQIMTLVICFAAALLGLANDYLLGRFADRHFWYGTLYRVVPNLSLYWPADALTQGHDFTGNYLAWVSGYTALIVAAVLALAVALFQTREVG